MASPEDRARRRSRFHNKIARELKDVKYRQRVKEDKKRVEVKDMTHADLIRLINEEEDNAEK